MNPIHIRRLTAALAGLACAWFGLAVAAPAAFANVTVPPPVHPPPLGHVVGPVYKVPVHTVVAGGMPGWQIALIAIGAALLAAAAAVLAYRVWAARRKPVTAAAESTPAAADARLPSATPGVSPVSWPG
jgi:hypothetical protein